MTNLCIVQSTGSDWVELWPILPRLADELPSSPVGLSSDKMVAQQCNNPELAVM